jgi:tetratricopeptide (TPR) repeat protein
MRNSSLHPVRIGPDIPDARGWLWPGRTEANRPNKRGLHQVFSNAACMIRQIEPMAGPIALVGPAGGKKSSATPLPLQTPAEKAINSIKTFASLAIPFQFDNSSPAWSRFSWLVKPANKELSFEDARHLQAAEGWLGLGDVVSASDELEEITLAHQTHPTVLHVRYAIYAKRGQWDMAADMAEKLTPLLPDKPETWIKLAYATRRKTGGGIPDAKRILLAAEAKFPADCLIPFNLACYCSQLHEFDQAAQWLKKAAAIDERTVRKMAADDPDLNPLWQSKGKAFWEED